MKEVPPLPGERSIAGSRPWDAAEKETKKALVESFAADKELVGPLFSSTTDGRWVTVDRPRMPRSGEPTI
jgi:hypothetical protein